MDTRVWGPHAWEFIHTVSFAYPENPTFQDRERYTTFFHSLAHVLPCPTCRNHFNKLLHNDLPISKHLGSQEALSRWAVDAHNIVNERLGKPTLDYDFVKEKFHSQRGTCEAGKIVHSPGNCSKKVNLVPLWITLGLALPLVILGVWLMCRSSHTSKSRAK